MLKRWNFLKTGFYEGITFVFFFLIVYTAYLSLQRYRTGQNLLLLAASYVFYGWWDWRFLGLLAVSTGIDFLIARKVHQLEQVQAQTVVSGSRRQLGTRPLDVQARRRQLLGISIASNLVILGFFKYFNFFADSMVTFLGMFGLDPSYSTLQIVLPVGISFYTFQSMGYTIDVYRGRVAPSRNILEYALYVAFFPQLVAGPIERAVNLIPQIQSKRLITPVQLNAGLYLILWGFFKKVVIADNLGRIANQVFAGPTEHDGLGVVVGMLAFTGQILADFSGYSDIARGVAKLLGFELMVNFNLPYFAKNPSEFWRRWHISFSTWIRDYLYIPLGGNRGGRLSTYRNLFLSMVLAGLWHGAAWTFILWGAYHGAILVVYRFLTESRQATIPHIGLLHDGKRVGQIAIMFVLTTIGWVIFRAEGVQNAIDMLTNIDSLVKTRFEEVPAI